jgi:hypothetical protein
MTWLWIAIGLTVLIVWVFSLVDIFSRHLVRRQTLAWVLIVVLLPIAGSILYWVLRGREARGD